MGKLSSPSTSYCSASSLKDEYENVQRNALCAFATLTKSNVNLGSAPVLPQYANITGRSVSTFGTAARLCAPPSTDHSASEPRSRSLEKILKENYLSRRGRPTALRQSKIRVRPKTTVLVDVLTATVSCVCDQKYSPVWDRERTRVLMSSNHLSHRSLSQMGLVILCSVWLILLCVGKPNV